MMSRQVASIKHRMKILSSLTTGGVFLGRILHEESSSCSTEAHGADLKSRRRRPLTYGSSIPSISQGGIITLREKLSDVNHDREDCPLCKKFGSGPCGDAFRKWLACTDDNKGNDINGDPLYLTECSVLAASLAECLERNSDYYQNNEIKHDEFDERPQIEELKDAWGTFVRDIEHHIQVKKYNVVPFPKSLKPQIQVRLASKTGVAFFQPQTHNGSTIIAAYILDDVGNLLAAGSKDEMDMGDLYGCALQFEILNDMKSSTCRAIYDSESDDVTIFSTTMLVPQE